MDFIFKRVVYFISSFIRIITTATRPISEWVLDILYWIVIGRTKKLPPINNKVLLMSARELAAKIRNQELRAEEVMAAYIQRCKSIHPIVNAQVDERFDAAMEEAIIVDQMLERSTSKSMLARTKPLLGVPFTCKESVGVKGLAQTNGIVKEKDRKAPLDADAAMLYREAGAIPLVVTNVPMFSRWWETANRVFGKTFNPFDNRRSVGGSSGGEGVLITACGGVIGIGSDLAGSIRLPASFCGIYGHKPTRGLISNTCGWPYADEGITNDFGVTGPMCRYVEDLPMLTMLLAGENASTVEWLNRIDFRRLAVFYMEELPGCLLSATNDIKASVRKAVRHFETEYNITAMKLYIPEMKYAFDIWECKNLEVGILPLKQVMDSKLGPTNLTWEFIKSLFGRSKFTWPVLYNAAVDRTAKNKYYYKCLDKCKELERKLEEYLQGDAILLLPTSPDPPPHYLMTIPKYPNLAYTCIFNTLGYPATQVPTGLSRGVPIGIQVVSRQLKDNLTLAAAVELDKVFNGWINPGPVAE